MKCKVCKTKKDVKQYVIADDLENPQPYCAECWDELFTELIITLGNLDILKKDGIEKEQENR